jgi:purine-binding chemotaxis protein CheW
VSRNQDKSQHAMESYLDDLFQDEVVEPGSTTMPEAVARNYQLGTRKTANTEAHRHEIERVERLLDDYNRRHQTELAEVEQKVTLLRPVLEPEQAQYEQIVETPAASADSEPELQEQTTELKAYGERPEWSKQPFQALMFHVAGMELAVPLVSLGGIHRMDKEVTELFGKPDWFMGLTPGLEGNINVVDTCRWVMPEKYGEAKSKGLNYSFIIMLGESLWGMACSHVETAITVEPGNVKWRANDTRRPWLAGMLIEERCVLLDVDVLIDLLDSNYQR